MAKMSFGSRGGRIRTRVQAGGPAGGKTPEELVREMKEAARKPAGEDYRDRSLALHGLVCGRCGREFDLKNRHLLTVHHKDGNHHNNPPDGSNWENLCVYCHDQEHSRGVFGDQVAGEAVRDDRRLVHEDPGQGESSPAFGDLMRQAMARKQRKENKP